VCLAASRGLGLGVAKEMAAAGARTLLVGRDRAKLEEAVRRVVKDLEETGPYPGVGRWHRPELKTADLLDPSAAGGIMAEAADLFGGIDVLVNNIGGPPVGRFHELTAQDWDLAFQRLFQTVIRQIQAALPYLRKSRAPRVLTVTSVSARQPIPQLLLSNTFRPGLTGLTKSLAQEWGPEGILINNLAPGMFETERLLELEEAAAAERGVPMDEVRRDRVREIPLGRYGRPEELGRAAVFLASPANTYVTGQTILCDGGLYKGL